MRWLVLAVVMAACARDPRNVIWDGEFEAAMDLEDGPRAERMAELYRTAIRNPDRGAALYERGIALERTDEEAAAEHWAEVARTGPRRVDRARAHYQLSRMAERHGDLAIADEIDKVLVVTYPDLMPGERGLAHLVRRARERGDAAMDALLAWLHDEPAIASSPLADNALFLAAEEAEQRWRRGDATLETTAEELYRRLAKEYPTSTLWNDSLWNLSYMQHQRGAFDAEIESIRTIYRARSTHSLFGQNEHDYYWKGQLRVARVQWLDLGRPREAAASYLRYREMFPATRQHDDMLFFAGCALRAAGDSPDALWDEMKRDFPESRYMRRMPNPSAEQCVPPEVE